MLYRQPVLLLLLLVLAPVAAKAQRDFQAEELVLRRAIQLSRADSGRVKLWLQLGQLYASVPSRWEIDMDTAYAYARKAETLSRSLHFTAGYDQSQVLAAQASIQLGRSEAVGLLLRNQRLQKNREALLVVGRQILKKPGEEPADLDSARTYAEHALRVSVQAQDYIGQVESWTALGDMYGEKNNRGQAVACYGRATALIKQVAAPLAQAQLWYQIGNGYARAADEFPLKIAAYERARDLYRQLGNTEFEAIALKEVADMHQSQGLFAQSLRELLVVLHMQQAVHSRKLHYTYDLIGAVDWAMGNYEQAFPHVLAAIANSQATRDTTSIDVFRFRLARLYEATGQPAQALRYYQQVLARARQPTGPKKRNVTITTSLIMAHLLIDLNRPGEALKVVQQVFRQYPPRSPYYRYLSFITLGKAYAKQRAYAKAERYFLSALHIVRHERFPLEDDKLDYAIDAYANLSLLYAAKKQFPQARNYLQDALRLAEQRAFVARLRNLHLQAFKLDSLQGNLTSAIAHYQQYKALNDSIFNERKSSQLISFQVQYEMQQKEQEIHLQKKNVALLTQRSQVQQASLRAGQTQRKTLLASGFLLLVIIALGYNRYSLKQRSNQQLLTQQQALQLRQDEIDRKNAALEVLLTEKEWLLKEVHHRVKNNLQVVMSLLNSQASHMTDGVALTAIQESQHRVQVMALIHQKIYQSEQGGLISMPAYVKEIVSYLRDTYNLVQPIYFELDVEPVELDIVLAVPVGLILNEALTNVFKYAFPNGRSGRVRVALHRLDDVRYQFEIKDDGVGLPAGYSLAGSRSLGMTLMHGFGRQLGGELRVSSAAGLTISLEFQEELASPILNHSDHAH